MIKKERETESDRQRESATEGESERKRWRRREKSRYRARKTERQKKDRAGEGERKRERANRVGETFLFLGSTLITSAWVLVALCYLLPSALKCNICAHLHTSALHQIAVPFPLVSI